MPPFFYIDSWPITRPNTVVITDAELAERLSRATPERPSSYPKPPTLNDLNALLGETSILKVGGT
jgi:hypothetical protein